MQSPFKFLSAYEKEDRSLFFGRDEEIAQLYDLTFRSSLMLIYGLSGTGKTSLIRCGLASELKDADWLPIFVRRRQDLNASLRAELERVSITPFLDYNGDGRISITEAVSSLYLDFFKPIYLIFDQFEELFILGTADEQKEFIREISELLESQQNCKVLICMREEYIGALYDFERQVPELLNKRLRLEQMNRANLQTVIGKTTKGLGIDIETPDQTIIQILENIGGKKTASVSLPYLQVYLDKLYRKAYKPNEKVIFTQKLVQETGEIQDVLDDFLADQIQDIDAKQGRTDFTRRLLNEFLTTEGTKCPRTLSEVQASKLLPPDAMQNLLLDLVNRRILQAEEDRYELAHDSLAAAIDRRRTAEERAIVEVSKMVKEGLTAYQKTGGLMNAENLKYIQAFLPKISLSEAEKDFLAKSEQKIKANKRQRQKIIIGLSLLTILTIFAVGLSIYFNQKNSYLLVANELAELKLRREKQEKEYERLTKRMSKEAEKNIFKAVVISSHKHWEKLFVKISDKEVDFKQILYNKIDTLIFSSWSIDRIPNEVFLCKNIIYLEFSFNQITTLSPEIGELKNLTSLNLGSNRLTTLPPQIKELKNLTSLYLSDNRLTTLPPQIEELKSLRTLDLSKNSNNTYEFDFISICKSISKLKNLTKLNLRDNGIRIISISDNERVSINESESLTHLDLSLNRLRTIPFRINDLKNLTYLNLRGNPISEEEQEKIRKRLPNCEVVF